MKHYFNEGKEIINQGRRPKQQKGNETAAIISFIGLIAILSYIFLTQ